jgi:purine-nucleoside phosphorylase
MSTVHEAIAARHCGMTVFGCSLITNECIVDYETDKEPNHEEVMEASRNGANKFQTFIAKLVKGIADNNLVLL